MVGTTTDAHHDGVVRFQQDLSVWAASTVLILEVWASSSNVNGWKMNLDTGAAVRAFPLSSHWRPTHVSHGKCVHSKRSTAQPSKGMNAHNKHQSEVLCAQGLVVSQVVMSVLSVWCHGFGGVFMQGYWHRACGSGAARGCAV